MIPRWRLLLLLVPGLLMGCIDVSTTVRVNGDGSGVVEERLLMSEEMSQMLNSMGESSEGGVVDRDKLQQQAREMGPGVTLQTVQPLRDGKRDGYQAVFSFTDINQLRLDQNPGNKSPAQKPVGEDETAGKEFITFQHRPGPMATLTISTPQKQASAEKPAAGVESPAAGGSAGPGNSEQDKELAMQMMAKLFDGLRIAIAVEAMGDIVSTNATHAQGSRITLLELDFQALLSNAERFARFAAADPQSVTEAKALMNDVEGIKVELEPVVTIQFKGR